MLAFSGPLFVGPVLGGFLGDSPRVLGQIKVVPEDFIVQERTTRNHLCTIWPNNDLSHEQIEASTGEFVGATLVKCKLTTTEAVLRLTKALGLRSDQTGQITYAGLKDRWAVTAQRVVIIGVPIEKVRALSKPHVLHNTGFFIKDVARAEKPLRQGHLVANHFQLRVGLPGMNKEQIADYVNPRVSLLSQRGWSFPNFYGRQRLGRRQNLTRIGYELITKGSQAAIKTFLTETSELEKNAVTTVRKKLADTWTAADEAANCSGCNIAEKEGYFQSMQWQLDGYQNLNLAHEYMLVARLKELRDCNKVILKTKKDVTGLWVGALQGYWFNRALEKHISGEIQLTDGRIPLYIKDKSTEDWYRQHGLADAILDDVDPFIKEHFLSPPERFKPRPKSGHAFVRRNTINRNFRQPETPGPRRNAMIRVLDFKHELDDDAWRLNFELESGGYATSVLQMFVDLDTGDDALSDERALS